MLIASKDTPVLRYRVGIISPTMDRANIIPFSNLVEVLNSVSTRTVVINIYTVKDQDIFNSYVAKETNEIIYVPGSGIFKRIINYILLQLKISSTMLPLRNQVDLWVFYLGDTFLIPVISSKLMRKKTILVMGGFLEREINLKEDHAAYILKLIKKCNLSIIDKIILYSPALIYEWNLGNYINKISILYKSFVDIDLFNIYLKPIERENVIGYIGRFSEEKGVMNFLKAILLLTEDHQSDVLNLRFFIGGDGPLRAEISTFLHQHGLNNKVELSLWINHSDLPQYLNRIKLLVLPSFSEGLPNIILESMACGTAILAPVVGAIPDIIKDGENGFLMETNSPECIASNILRAVNCSEYENIVSNARNEIENKFTFKHVSKNWENVFEFF